MQPRALIFDCDGTLADSMPLHWRAWNTVCKRNGIELAEARFYKLGGVPSQKIIIAGFSQGGAVGYEIALSYQDTLAGLIALSTYFATKETVQYSAANKSLPIFIGHGNHDQMVVSNLGVSAHEILKEKKYPVEYHTYEVAHGVHLQEIKDIGIWISKILELE